MHNWEIFHHEADIGVRGSGDTLEEAFCAAGQALTAVIEAPERVRPSERVPICVKGGDPELLLVAWLNALIFEMDTRNMLFSEFALERRGDELVGEARGEKIDVSRHSPAVEVKGATYAELRVCRHDGRWLAQCVVDV